MSEGATVRLVDDHLLLRVLLGDEPSGLDVSGAASIATTGLWYHRLCRALADDRVVGALSGQIGSVDPAVAQATIAALVDLPEGVTLVSLRDLAWPMAELVSDGTRLNLLSLEALAAAQHLDATICLAAADENPPLVAAAQAADVPIRVVEG